MVDEVRLARLLQRLGEQVSHLRARASEDRVVLLQDEARLSGTKYRFLTAIEAVLDVAHHLLASELWGPAEDSSAAVRLLARPAEDSSAAVRLLARHGVIDDELAQRLAAATGFRNVLVHGYAEIDDERFLANLELLGDFDAFTGQVRRWVEARS